MLMSVISTFLSLGLLITTPTTIQPTKVRSEQVMFVKEVRAYSVKNNIPDGGLSDQQLLAQGENVCMVSDKVGVVKAFDFASQLALKSEIASGVIGLLGYEFATAIMRLCPRHQATLTEYLTKTTPVHELDQPLRP
jgi:hypothetical protein